MTAPNPFLPSKNSTDLHQSHERPLAKNGVDMSTPVHPVATPLAVAVDLLFTLD